MSGNIPIQCFQCGKPIGHKIFEYIKIKNEKYGTNNDIPAPIPTQRLSSQKTSDGEILDSLGQMRTCCRTMVLSFPQTMAASING